ncbi:hypothetical protein P4S65_00055 [Pseudoalteromonas sp. B131b]|uniref:hypothetical protein n=1 Tax=Pseudoalteromonas sp. B131b TaxID=630493 RepID=UPI00301D6352
MKNIFLVTGVILSSFTLISCGGSENKTVETDTPKENFIASLSSTSWERNCVPVYNDSTVAAYNNNTLTINSSLQSTSIVELFDATDTACDSIISSLTYTSQLEVLDATISEESIEAFGLDSVPIEIPDNVEIQSSYTLIYIDSERLYFGQNSGSNLGETPETRHSSISLDEYFSKIVN